MIQQTEHVESDPDIVINIGQFFDMAQTSYLSEMEKESLMLKPKDPHPLTISSGFPPHLLARWNAPVTSTGTVYGFMNDDIQEIRRDMRERQQESNRKKIIEGLVAEQIQHYSRTGERLYSIAKVSSALKMRADTGRVIARKFLQNLFKSNAKVVYDMVFGKAYTSIHNVRQNCAKAGLILKTTATEWFQMVKNRQKEIRLLKVKVKCIDRGHITYKTVERIGGSGKTGCEICGQISSVQYLIDRAIKRKDVIAQLEDSPFELESSSKDFTDAINKARAKGGRNTDALLTWRHKECDHVFERSYKNFFRAFSCPKCSQRKNQKITHAYCEHAFGVQFEVEYSLKKIFDINENPEIKKLHQNVHIDIFQNLDLRDKNGNLIHLGVRYNGKQHEDSREGWETYKGIAKHPDINPGSEKYNELRSQWRRLIRTDKIKEGIFKKNEEKGYYLITVDYRIKPNQRLQYIINTFERLTGVKLDKIIEIDWRRLL